MQFWKIPHVLNFFLVEDLGFKGVVWYPTLHFSEYFFVVEGKQRHP